MISLTNLMRYCIIKRAYKERFYPTSEQYELLNDVRAYTAEATVDEPESADSVEQSKVQDEAEANEQPKEASALRKKGTPRRKPCV